jgi:hypothetical protein
MFLLVTELGLASSFIQSLITDGTQYIFVS